MSSRILVVDDDVALAAMIGIVLEGEGYTVSTCPDGAKAVAAFQEHHPDLVLLDVMLPGMDGFEVCAALRAESNVPIVMLTARSDTADVVTGLEAGADDYVPKPFKPRELVARVRARLRGREDAGEERIVLADLEIDVPGHAVRRGDRLIALTPLEFDLLATLARTPSKVFSREELPRAAPAFQDRARSGEARDRRHRPRGGLPCRNGGLSPAVPAPWGRPSGAPQAPGAPPPRA